MARHFLTIRDASREEAERLVERAITMKEERFTSQLLEDKTVVLLFEKASTRTRLSFEVAVRQLGGGTIFMTDRESQLGRNEPLKDTARVVSRYADCMVVRTFGQDKLVELARHGSVPVVNALSDQHHPCQVMADVMTMTELTPDLSGIVVAWVGDGNNMAHSWIEAAARFPFTLKLACPEGYMPDAELVEAAMAEGAKVEVGHDPIWAATGAHYVNTDVWASMGQEGESEARAAIFAPYQVSAALLSHAAEGCRVLHCLPAHRGEEITDEVIEGPASIVWDQAENRLHIQKAILEWLFTQ